MITFPNAKINLGLYVESRRPDGYHNISTVFYPIPLNDVVELVPSDRTELFCYGNPVDCPPEKNLAMKAYRLMEREFNLPAVAIHLYKHIPDGAGLGGGSADASAVLSTLNAMFRIGLTEKELAGRAARIGADCPFFIYNRPMAARGIGDMLTPSEIDLTGHTIVVVKPEAHISTAEAYSGVVPRVPETDIETIVRRDISEWRESLRNDFEPTVFRRYPELAAIKRALYEAGATYAAMSGSGSAIFGIFGNDNLADRFISGFPELRLFKLRL